jgi:hypothetical protein
MLPELGRHVFPNEKEHGPKGDKEEGQTRADKNYFYIEGFDVESEHDHHLCKKIEGQKNDKSS